MDNCLAKKLEHIWRKSFCDATVIPVLGVPSDSFCVMTLTHTMGQSWPQIRIDGLNIRSMLVNNAFYSAEVSNDRWVNLYQIQIPNVPGRCGSKSSGEIYTETLIKLGISIEGDGYNWKGTNPFMLAINSKAIGMHPIEFSKKQIAAVKVVTDFINEC